MEWIQVPIESRFVVDLVIALVFCEALLLIALLKSSGQRSRVPEFLIPLASGAVLLLALRSSVGEETSVWLNLLLAVAGMFHLWDLKTRWPGRQDTREES